MTQNKQQPPEQCAVFIGQCRERIWHGRLRQRQTGQPASVDFDWSWVLDREERFGDVLGFYHTHPAGQAVPSSRDLRTMCAWVSCLGKPLLCIIESDEELTSYLFPADESDGQEMEETQRFPRHAIVAIEAKEKLDA